MFPRKPTLSIQKYTYTIHLGHAESCAELVSVLAQYLYKSL